MVSLIKKYYINLWLGAALVLAVIKPSVASTYLDQYVALGESARLLAQIEYQRTIEELAFRTISPGGRVYIIDQERIRYCHAYNIARFSPTIVGCGTSLDASLWGITVPYQWSLNTQTPRFDGRELHGLRGVANAIGGPAVGEVYEDPRPPLVGYLRGFCGGLLPNRPLGDPNSTDGVNDINSSGVICGWAYAPGQGKMAWLSRDRQEFTRLLSPLALDEFDPSDSVVATALDYASGTTAVGVFHRLLAPSHSGYAACIWRNSRVASELPLLNRNDEAFALDHDGVITVGYTQASPSAPREACLWHNNRIIYIPLWDSGVARGVCRSASNGNLYFIVGSASWGGYLTIFNARTGTFLNPINLNDERIVGQHFGWFVRDAYAVNAYGNITGVAVRTTGEERLEKPFFAKAPLGGWYY